MRNTVVAILYRFGLIVRNYITNLDSSKAVRMILSRIIETRWQCLTITRKDGQP